MSVFNFFFFFYFKKKKHETPFINYLQIDTACSTAIKLNYLVLVSLVIKYYVDLQTFMTLSNLIIL
jgi:hypothetical protein